MVNIRKKSSKVKVFMWKGTNSKLLPLGWNVSFIIVKLKSGFFLGMFSGGLELN